MANQLECALDEAFPEDGLAQDLVVALACYRPEGGEHLYSEQQMLELLKSHSAAIEKMSVH